MNSQVLQAELSNLIQESKRKQSDLRNAAEHSLGELKGLPSTSEVQLTADLLRKPHFVKPFVLACFTRQAKLAAIGVGSIQKLVAAGALPPERLKDILEGLHEITSLSLDVQLKVLQTLPSLFQHYADRLSGELLASTLEVCATLQNCKTVAVSNTAAATLQQLVVSIFERVTKEDEAQQDAAVFTTALVDNKRINISATGYDALRIFEDLCSLAEGENLQFLGIKSLSRVFVLELIESILTSHHDVFSRHPEQAEVLRRRLMPLTVRYLSERHKFTLSVRSARIMLLLFKFHLSLLPVECDMALSLLTHLLDTDSSSPWKRALCLEVFKILYSEPGLIRQIYSLFDEKEGRRNILSDHMACLARLASEKPSLIGVSHQSSVPTAADPSGDTIEDQVALEAVGVSGVIGSPAADTNVCGISSQWSLIRIPYLDTLEKVDNPSPPESYIYSLVLNCVSAFSEEIAKFILPLTASETKSKRKHRGSVASKDGHRPTRDGQKERHSSAASKISSVPLNPLDLEGHAQFAGIKATAGMIDACWPAVLATCSTFLYAALDGEFYHSLVRAFQKLAHVAGLLRLSTPRDAFLTTLGKAAIPSDLFNASASGGASSAPESQPNLRAESPAGRSPSHTEFPNTAADSSGISLSTRNLLCLRALLNLGIALGPTLDRPSWSVILETLQHAELIINFSTMPTPRLAPPSQGGEKVADSGTGTLKMNVGAEITAVQGAATKMFENTGDYPDKAFELILTALLGLTESTEKSLAEQPAVKLPSSPNHAQTSLRTVNVHQTKRSVSIGRGRARKHDDELKFVLAKAGDLAKANSRRLAMLPEDGRIWDVLVNSLVEVTRNEQINTSLRLNAADVLDKVVFGTIKLGGTADPESQNQIQLRGLLALKRQISTLYTDERSSSAAVRSADIEVHDLALETLKSVLEECGESVTIGWDLVFDLISSVFDRSIPESSDEPKPDEKLVSRPASTLIVRSPKLMRAAYDSLQLVASDFLALLPASCLLEMIESFSNFAAQKEEFNISLTTTTHFWNMSDFLRNRMGSWSTGPHIDISSSEGDLRTIGKDPDLTVSRNALWLLLLLRIVDLSVDSRSEIRNGAVQTVLRIMDQYGDQLPPEVWNLCLNRILFVMAEAIQQKALETMKSEPRSNSSDRESWVDTTVVVTKGLSNLIANFFASIIQHDGFEQSWARLLRYFQVLISLEVLELKETAFSSFSEVLSRIQTHEDIGLDSVKAAWHVWVNHHPVSQSGTSESNQEFLFAYIRSFEQLYRLLKDKLTESDVVQVLEKFKVSIWESIVSRYSPDLDRVSELQNLVVECLRSLCSEITSSQPAIIACLSEFSDSPFTKWSPEHGKSRPRFVAFSKSIMRLLSWYITENGIRTDILTDGTINRLFEHLANPILHKYVWPGKDSSPDLWQVATTTSLDVLQVAIPHVERRYGEAEKSTVAHFWRNVVNISRGIVTVIRKDSNLQGADISSDESFDMAAFQRIRSMIIPALGSSYIPDKVRCEFACTLFYSSLIYPPQRLDLPGATIEKEPLQNLYKIRMGRTYDPPPTPRSNLSYVVIGTLFDLASARPATGTNKETEKSSPSANGTPAYVTLAKSISPYLILRCAISLKAYIADQPLRGLMPQPMIARAELLYLLRRLVELKSEPAAIPPAGPKVPLGSHKGGSSNDGDGDDESMYKKHLGWIYPLVIRAVRVAGKETEDNSVLEALTSILESVGGDGEDTDDE